MLVDNVAFKILSSQFARYICDKIVFVYLNSSLNHSKPSLDRALPYIIASGKYYLTLNSLIGLAITSILAGYPPYLLRISCLSADLFQAIVLALSKTSLDRMMGSADRMSNPHSLKTLSRSLR